MDVTVVGGSVIDLISYETSPGEKCEKNFGGKGANQCVMAARFGAKTAMVSKVGDDDFGREYIEHLKRNNVNTDHVTIGEEMITGCTTIFVSENGENSIKVDRGATDYLSEEEVNSAESTIKNSKMLMCQMEVPQQSTLAALRLARKHGVKTIFNASPARRGMPHEMFSGWDLFCVNQKEAEKLTKLPASNTEKAKMAALALLDKGCNSVILTLGPRGSVYVSSSDRSPQVIKCPKVTALDTTGAGDCFLGSLAYYLALRPDLEMREAISRAGRVASVSVQARGTQISYPWREDLPADLFD